MLPTGFHSPRSRIGSRFLVFGLSILSLVPGVEAATEARLEVQQFLEGELDGLAIDDLGQLRLAPVTETTFSTEALYAWSLALDHRGRLVVGTGDDGRLFRVEGDEARSLADTDAVAILSLMAVGDEMLAGSSPEGIVYRVDDDGTVETALQTEGQSVWALAEGSEPGTFLAASGPGAAITRGPDGEVLHRLAATNATVLLRDGDSLWIGTEGPASVYRVTGDDTRTPVLLYEAEEEEIRALVSDGAGGVIALSLRTESSESDGTSNRITHIDAEGRVEEIRAGDEALISMAAGPDGSVLVGELETGHVGRVDRQGRLSIWADIDGDPVSFLVDGDERWIGSGNLGSVVRLAPSRDGHGTWRSAVLSTPRVQSWGRPWADVYEGEVEIRSRSGVRQRADTSWSEWSDFHPVDRELSAPVAPHLQVEVRLGRGTALDAIHLSWVEHNLAPRVQGLRVEPRGQDLFFSGGQGGPQPLRQTFEDGLQVDYSYQPPPQPVPPEVSDWVRGIRTVVWNGEDPNGDPLRFEIQTRRLPDGEWVTHARNVSGRVWSWDTRSVVDGAYRLRVVADDGLAHPPGEERRGEQIGGVVRVDNLRPEIEELRWGDGRLRFRARDAASPLRGVDLRVEDGDWRPLLPRDRVVDSRVEDFDVDIPREHPRWWLRVVDAAGNTTLRALGPGASDGD